jgi:hypothetical protein
MFGSSPLFCRLLAQPSHPAGPSVVRGEGEQRLVQLGHGLLVVELVDHVAHVLDPAVDVGLRLGDVADIQFLAGRWHDLHHADGAHGAAGVLVEL